MKKILTISLAAIMLLALTASAPVSAHERIVSTSLSINVSDSHPDRGDTVKFTGQLKSEWKRCKAFQKVTLKRGRTPVQTTKTSRSGFYSFTQRIKSDSNWRVRFTGKKFGKHPHVHRCLPSTSRIIRIRVG